MVRDCTRDNSGFGVCLVLESARGTGPSQHARTGTLALIRDWYTLHNGLLGITTEGRQRFLIQRTRMRDNGLLVADVKWLEEAPAQAIPESFGLLAKMVERFMEKLEKNYPGHTRSQLEDAVWVSYRLTELLPLKNAEKQLLLEIDNPLQRLQMLLEIIPRFQP